MENHLILIFLWEFLFTQFNLTQNFLKIQTFRNNQLTIIQPMPTPLKSSKSLPTHLNLFKIIRTSWNTSKSLQTSKLYGTVLHIPTNLSTPEKLLNCPRKIIQSKLIGTYLHICYLPYIHRSSVANPYTGTYLRF